MSKRLRDDAKVVAHTRPSGDKLFLPVAIGARPSQDGTVKKGFTARSSYRHGAGLSS
jgi:hypothetical protein